VRGKQTNLVESLVGDSHRLLDGGRVKREQHALVLEPNRLHKQRFGAVRENRRLESYLRIIGAIVGDHKMMGLGERMHGQVRGGRVHPCIT
jgi:hypothetical protein